jgi:hypothetical protein
MKNCNNKIWKYFKIGDVIRDADDSIWGDKLFEIYSFHGNDYLPLVSVYFYGKPKINKNMCNFDIREIKLINAFHRPFKKLKKTDLIKLMKRENIEAKREFIIRLNTKNL